MQPGVFDGLSKLRTLYLFNNKIAIIPQDAFKYLNNLRVLNLSYNKINKIHFEAFQHFSKLWIIDVTANICINANFEKMKNIDDKFDEKVIQHFEKCFINYHVNKRTLFAYNPQIPH